jgi:hypothetical protein
MGSRYSIIPAGAVVDACLDGRRDLQVLCFLGMHTDKSGWCFLRQGTIANGLGCGRSTVQRSLKRLMEAGWVCTRDFVGERPHACHAYQIVFDRNGSNPPSERISDLREQPDWRRPVDAGEKVHQARALVPGNMRAPVHQEVPAHTRAHNDQDSSGGNSGALAFETGSISELAHALAAELALIAGHDSEFLPPTWISEGPALRLQMMLDRGWQPAMMRETAKAVMSRKRDGPPSTIRYFERPFARAHAQQSRPEPLPTISVIQSKPKPTHAQETRASTSWQQSRDRFRSAFAALRAFNEESE